MLHKVRSSSSVRLLCGGLTVGAGTWYSPPRIFVRLFCRTNYLPRFSLLLSPLLAGVRVLNLVPRVGNVCYFNVPTCTAITAFSTSFFCIANFALWFIFVMDSACIFKSEWWWSVDHNCANPDNAVGRALILQFFNDFIFFRWQPVSYFGVRRHTSKIANNISSLCMSPLSNHRKTFLFSARTVPTIISTHVGKSDRRLYLYSCAFFTDGYV